MRFRCDTLYVHFRRITVQLLVLLLSLGLTRSGTASVNHISMWEREVSGRSGCQSVSEYVLECVNRCLHKRSSTWVSGKASGRIPEQFNA